MSGCVRRVVSGLPFVVLAAAAAVFAGCGGGSKVPSLRPGDVNGRLVVHTGLVPGIPFFVRATVFLGDGSQFLAQTDEHGDVVFEDANLQGAQDITTVTLFTHDVFDVLTIEDVQRAEVWVPPSWGVTLPDAGAPTRHVRIAGTVSGIAGGGEVRVKALGSYDDTWVPEEGDFQLVADVPPGPVGLLAVERSKVLLNPVQLGLVSVTVGDAGFASGVDLPLDRKVQGRVDISLLGAEAYESPTVAVGGELMDAAGRSYLSFPISLDSTVDRISLAPPFDVFHVVLSAGVQQSCSNPILPVLGEQHRCPWAARGAGETRRFDDMPTSVQFSAMAPLEVLSPKLDGSWVGTTPTVRLRADPSAAWVWVGTTQESGGGSWQVWAPAKDESLHFIQLPDGIAPQRHPIGKRPVVVVQGAAEEGFSFEEAWGPVPGVEGRPTIRQSSVTGEMDFYGW